MTKINKNSAFPGITGATLYLKVTLIMISFFCFGQLKAQLTTVSLSPTQDTHVSSTTNSSPSSVTIDMLETSGEIRRGLMVYNLSGIPDGAHVTSAIFRYRPVTTGPNYSIEITPQGWDENTVTWATLPWSNNGTISDMPLPVIASASAATIMNVNITGMVSYMINRQVLTGMKLLKTTANTSLINIASQNNATTANRPLLIVSYYNPIQISVVTVPSSTGSSSDGAADITVTGGSGTFTYQWYNASMSPLATTQDLTNIAAGVYALQITDVTTTKVYRQYVIVGNNSGPMTINLQPDESYSWDANIRGVKQIIGSAPPPEIYRNYATETYLRSGTVGSPIVSYAPFIRFNYLGLEQDNNISIDNASLTLYGNGHVNGGGGTNFKIQRVTQFWYEDFVTGNNQPTLTTTGEIDINPGPTTSTSNVTANVTGFVTYHSQNPSQNYGYTFRRYNVGSGPFSFNQYVNFHSSSASTASNRPLLSITFRVAKSYAELKREVDGALLNVKNYLHFRYKEEYNDSNGSLTYSIYRLSNHQLVATQANQALPVTFGDNRYSINLKTIIPGGLTTGAYQMEILNEKKERFFLKFNVN
ncbi:MAG: DNRLRE domain-containing protein [Sediminibacterium sp.]|nr:DNRLRE domain-containing protein [Sediminibacterium sp.]